MMGQNFELKVQGLEKKDQDWWEEGHHWMLVGQGEMVKDPELLELVELVELLELVGLVESALAVSLGFHAGDMCLGGLSATLIRPR